MVLVCIPFIRVLHTLIEMCIWILFLVNKNILFLAYCDFSKPVAELITSYKCIDTSDTMLSSMMGDEV